jgi:hypothetical protein
MKKTLALAALAAALMCGTSHAQQINVKIGVLTDMSSLYADATGQGSVAAAKMAAADFTKDHPNVKVEIVNADHQNKADVGSQIANQWYDVDHVDVIADVPNSGVALAITQVAANKNKIFLGSGPASSDLTGPKCNANNVQWTYDTWMLANGTGKAVVKTGGDTWFFLTSDYAFAIPGSSSPPTTPSVMRWSATPRPSSRRMAARCLARSVIRSTRTISPRFCYRRRPPRRRSSVSPMRAATPSTRSSRHRSSAS